MAPAANHGGLLAHANLTHVDALVQLAREVTHKLAKVHALLGREVADDLVAIEEVLDAHGLHIESALRDKAPEHRQGLLAKLCAADLCLCRGLARLGGKAAVEFQLGGLVLHDHATLGVAH